MEQNIAPREQLLEELHELRSRVQHLEKLDQDRKRLEERLRISEERFKALVQASPLAIISMDSEGAVTLWNPAAETIFGWSEAEVLGKPLPYVAETMQAEHLALRKRVLSGKAFSGIEVRRQTKGGLPIDISVSTAPLRDSKGDVCGIMSLNEDITERKRAEEALLKSEALFNKSQALGRIGSWELDLAANRLTWSDEVYRIFGLRSGGFVPSYETFLETVHPDDRETVNAAFSESVREGRDSYEIEHRILRRDNGEVRFVLEKCEHVKDAAGAIIRSLGMVQDVTDHRRSEAALQKSEAMFRGLIQSAPFGIVIAGGPEESALSLNRKFTETYGYAVEDFPDIDHWWQNAYPDEDYRRYVQSLWEKSMAEASGPGAGPVEAWVTCKDGSRRYTSVLRSNLGNVYAVFFIDLTARQLAEEALRRSEAQYRTLVEHLPQHVFVKDRGSVYLSCNSRFAGSVGRTVEDVVGSTDMDLYPNSRDAAKYRGDDRRVMETGVPSIFEEAYDLFGERHWARTTKVPLRSGPGAVVGVVGIFEDITEWREAQERLRLSEERYRSLVETTYDWIWELDAEARYVYASDKVRDLIGYAPEEVIGRTPFDFMPELEARTIEPQFKEIAARRLPFKALENRNLHKNGGLVVMETSGVPLFGLNGEFRGYRGMDRDITERKRAEEALRASEERLTQALRAADAGAWEWNMRTNKAVWSDENYLVLGLEPGSVEARYEHWLNAVHPEDRAAVDRLVTAAVQNRTDLDISFRVVWPDGSIHWINDRGKLVYDESGEPLGMYGIQIDITARKLAELAVVESERNYREIFNGTKDAIFIHDPQTGGIEDVNQGMLDMFGCTRAEALGLGIAELSLGTAPHDQRHAAEKLRRTLAEGPQTFEWMSRKRNGEQFWSEVVLKSTLIGGRRRVLAVVRDMDERKRIQEALRQKEEYYRSLFENAMDIVTIMRPDGTILFESPSVERIVGYKPEELIGLNAFALIHPEDAASTRQLFERLVNNPGSLERAEFRFRHREGSWRILEAVGSNLLAVPAVGAVVANLRDVTDRREMEQQLRASLQEKEILVREVHHRVKNNLQIILSLLNLQAETVQAPQVHEIFMVSKQRVKAIAMIHERLYSSGDLSSVGLSEYLKDLVHTIVQANRPDGSIAVQVDIPPIRLSVNTAVPCGLIVNELVTNSIKHAFAKGRKGHLKVEVRSAPENRLALLVEDDGRGLPEHIRLEDAKSLGLTIVRTLAKQLGGTVDVQRAAGARFHVTFANKP